MCEVVQTKVCSKCKVEKPVIDFGFLKSSKDGYRYHCKSCKNQESKNYRLMNKKPKKEKYDFAFITLTCVECGEYFSGNFRKTKKFCSQHCLDKSKNKRSSCIEAKKRYVANNIEKRKRSVLESQQKNYYKITNIERRKEYSQRLEIRLKNALRSRIKKSLKTNPKFSSTSDLVGCSLDNLRQHIESRFIEGMNWENWGRYGWHLDHIIPLSSAKTIEEMKKLCHFSNLQPLWWYDNLSKTNKISQEWGNA